MCFQAGLSPSRGEELRPTRALEGTLVRGYSRGYRRSGSRACCWCSARCVRCRPFGWRRRADRVPAGGSCVRKGTTRGAPLRGQRWALCPPFPPSPEAEGPASLGRQLQPPGTFRRDHVWGPWSLRAVVPSPRRRKDVGFCPLGLGEGEGLLRNRGRVPVARSGYLHWHTAPFLLPGRPQPRGRVLPVHPKCLPRSPRFGLWRRSGFCEPRRPRSPGSTIGWPPSCGSSGSGVLPRGGGSVAFLRSSPLARRSCGLSA